VAHLTDNFTFEGPLSPRVREAIASAFEQGWADPKKLSQASHRALNLRSSAIEEFAQNLKVSPASIEVTGEPNLLHHLGINGFLADQNHLFTSSVDVGKIRAIARAHKGPSTQLPVDEAGVIAQPGDLSPADLISLQAENGETGVHQELTGWRSLPAKVVLDGTRTTPEPGLLDGFAAATFDAQSWSGPAGVGFLVINDSQSYRYPLAHIAPIRTPGSYSLPLLVGAAIALAEFQERKTQIFSMRNLLAQHLRAVDGVRVVGDKEEPSRYLSVLVDEISGEEVLRTLLHVGISTDSGSACSAEDLAPSHVIGAMGLPTTGHLRMTIHPGMDESKVLGFVEKLKEVISSLRS
jgi:cysteine desulfurase